MCRGFIIYLYDEKTKTLKFAEGQDVDKEAFEKIAFAPGESIAGRVFQEKSQNCSLRRKKLTTI